MAGVNDWEHRMQLNFLPAKRWMISLHNELYHSSEKDFGVNWFCDASLSYKADRWEVSLVGRNLAGISRPREVLVKVCWDLWRKPIFTLFVKPFTLFTLRNLHNILLINNLKLLAQCLFFD